MQCEAREEPTSNTHQYDIDDNRESNEPTDDIVILEDISPTPPIQLLEEDDDVFMTHSSPTRLFIGLTEKRKNAADKNVKSMKLIAITALRIYSQYIKMNRSRNKTSRCVLETRMLPAMAFLVKYTPFSGTVM